MPKFRTLAVVVVVASGCTEAGPDTGPVTGEQVSAIYGGEDCPKSECGGSGNSPVMDGVYFWSLHAGGQRNNQRIYLVDARKASSPYRLATGGPGDQLIAISKIDGVSSLAHQDLVGLEMLLARDLPDETTRYYRVWITDVSDSTEMDHFWVGTGTWIENYTFRYEPLDDPDPDPNRVRWLCSHPTGDPNEVRAIVFGGDIYDADKKTITVGPDADGWFNIACYRGAPWKMHITGHTGVAQTRLGLVSNLNRRRAMLNAWTDNVCGTGTAFTHPEEPIKLLEQPNWLIPFSPGGAYLGAYLSREAIWGAHGALCLDTARLAEEDEKILDRIKEDCGGSAPPKCGALWPPGGFITTGNGDN